MTLQTKCSNLLLGLRHRGNLNDNALRPYTSVCLSQLLRRATALRYRHAGCLQLRHVRTADLFADGRRSAASRTTGRTAIGWEGHIVSPPASSRGGGVNLLIRPHRVHAIDGPNHSRCRLGPICVGPRSHVLLHRGNLANTIDPSVRRRHRYR